MVRIISNYPTIGKKKGETPEGSVQATPTTSVESVSEKERIHSIDIPLDTEEIAALGVKPEDLIRVRVREVWFGVAMGAL